MVAARSAGVTGRDAQVAQRLAAAYCQAFVPDLLPHAVALAERVFRRHGHLLDAQVEAVLARCEQFNAAACGYGMDVTKMAVTSLELLCRQQRQTRDLHAEVAELLSPAGALPLAG